MVLKFKFNVNSIAISEVPKAKHTLDKNIHQSIEKKQTFYSILQSNKNNNNKIPKKYET